jgi:excisionase family DNA binding protein
MSNSENSQAGERLLTPDEVANILQVKKSWIYRNVRTGNLPHIKLGKYLRFSQDIIAQVQNMAA